MSQHKIIILKDNKHTPAEAGDTIDHKLLSISAEQGNSLEAKDDGLFVAPSAGGGGGAENVALTREEKDFSGIYNNLFRNEANVYEYTFTDAAGQQQKFKEVIGRPLVLKYVVETGGNYGLAKHQIEHYRLIDEGQGTKGELDLAHAALGTPRLEGTVLKISMHHRQYEEKVGGSDQEVTVDLASLAGGPAFTEAPQGPANTTSGDDVPTDFIGRERNNLLAGPDKWLLVEVDGQRGAVPWFSI